MKLTVTMLKVNRHIDKFKIKGNIKNFSYKGGKYIVEPDAVNHYAVLINTLDKKDIRVPKSAEIFYFEESSTPIMIKYDANTIDSSLKYLNSVIAENALRQTGNIRSEAINKTIIAIKETFTLGNMAKASFAIVIMGSIIWGYLKDYGII